VDPSIYRQNKHRLLNFDIQPIIAIKSEALVITLYAGT